MKGLLRYLIIFLVLIGISHTAGAKKTTFFADTVPVQKAFIALPVNVLDILRPEVRRQMVKHYANDSIWPARNSMNGLSHIIAADADYMKVQLTNVSDITLRMLPLKKGGKILMTVYTVGAETEGDSIDYTGADSDIRFFDSSFQELPRDKYIKVPELKDFFSLPKGSITSMKEIRQMVPFYTTVYIPSEETTELTARLTIGKYISEDDMNILRLFIHPDISYLWNGTKFELQKYHP